MRQGEIARDDALTPVPAGRAYGVGTTFADDFIAAENIEEHDAGPGIEARGYWAGIWLRLKKDKLALAGGVFIPILFLVAFVGAPVAAHFIGHGPNEPFFASGGVDAELLPAKPLTLRPGDHGHRDREADPRSRRRLDPRSRRVPPDSLRRPGVARGCGGRDADCDAARVAARGGCRLLPRLRRHCDLPRDRDHDGIPLSPLRHRARLDRRDRVSTR